MAGKALSPEERKKCCQIVKPGTILGWFRQMAAWKYDSSESKVGRPRKRKDIRNLVVEMALANLGWGYTRIRDALRTGLKIEIGRTTVADILAEEGIEPAPEREKKRTWKQFMKSHWDTLSACDFFSVEVLGLTGMVRYKVSFVIELKSRAVEIAGIDVNGFLRNAKCLIHDRDPLFTNAFEAVIRSYGIKGVKTPAQSPNCNPHAERFVETIRHERLNHFVFFGERHLRYVLKEFMAHYHAELFPQGLGGQLIKKEIGTANDNAADDTVVCRSRLGGVLNFYLREAA